MQVLCGCSERHRFCVYCGELHHEPVPCAQMMELCKALEELHVELEEIPLSSTEHVNGHVVELMNV